MAMIAGKIVAVANFQSLICHVNIAKEEDILRFV
jgi:hypothetical protein